MGLGSLYPLATLLAFIVCVVLAAGLVRCRRASAAITRQLKMSTAAERAAVRQLRLGAHNLRSIGMTLQGHAEQLEAGGPGAGAGIAEAARNVFGIADYLDEWVQHAQPTHVLHEEVLDLGAVLDEAISEVRVAMEPGRRAWRVESEVLPLRLRADRRAVRHVLARALGLSVLGSGHDASIHIKLERSESSLALVVASQARPEVRGQPRADSAEPDPRLTLARTLMEAHGGALEVEESDTADRRVRVAFPAVRLIAVADAVRNRPPAAEEDVGRALAA